MLPYPSDRIWGFVILTNGQPFVPYFPKLYSEYPKFIRIQLYILHKIARYILLRRLKKQTTEDTTHTILTRKQLDLLTTRR